MNSQPEYQQNSSMSNNRFQGYPNYPGPQKSLPNNTNANVRANLTSSPSSAPTQQFTNTPNPPASSFPRGSPSDSPASTTSTSGFTNDGFRLPLAPNQQTSNKFVFRKKAPSSTNP